MSFQYSTGFKNASLDTASLKGTFDGGFIKVYSAPTGAPATADAALPSDAVLLVTYSDDGGAGGLSLAAAAASGAISKLSTQTWKGTAAATGIGAFFRYVRTGDTGALSTTDKRIQGTVGVSGADLNVSSTTFTATNEYMLDFFSLTFLGG
jgi:hypothetical protein